MKTEVLIVGGGLAGLSLADKLAREGVDFLLVEAQNRLGGRILTEDISGGAFDLGPAWFWPGQPRMAQLIDRLGLRYFEQYSAGDIVFQDQSGAVHKTVVTVLCRAPTGSREEWASLSLACIKTSRDHASG